MKHKGDVMQDVHAAIQEQCNYSRPIVAHYIWGLLESCSRPQSHILRRKPDVVHLKVHFMAEHKHARDLRAADRLGIRCICILDANFTVW